MKTILNRHLMLPRLNRSWLSTLSLAVLCAMAFTFTGALSPMMNTATAQGASSGADLAPAPSNPPPCYNSALAALRTARANHNSAVAAHREALNELRRSLSENPPVYPFVLLAAINVEIAKSNLQAAVTTLRQAKAALAQCIG